MGDEKYDCATVVDFRTKSLVCRHCGQSLPAPLGPTSFVVAYCNAFEEAHQRCAEGQPAPCCKLAREAKLEEIGQ